MLQKLRNDIFPIEGRQEDAEEFLSFILNKMNDEMIEVGLISLIKLITHNLYVPDEKTCREVRYQIKRRN